ncbi:MAG: hypothetical protein NPIRA02_40910 [Nitrospirales bacterium]|nr:MAG: hypothetical protein NPIRA02_40910 [Nitrospirales bacterium]
MTTLIEQMSYRVVSPNVKILSRFVIFLAICILSLSLSLPQDVTFAEEIETSNGSSKLRNIQRNHEQNFSIMQQQLRAYQNKLQESEQDLEAFQQKHGIISLETQTTLLLQQRKALDDALKSAENTSVGYREKLIWVEEQIKQVPQDIPLSSVMSEQGIIGGAKNNLLKLQLKEQQLLTKYTAENPHVKAVRQEMVVIKQFINEQEARRQGSVTTGKNPLYREMEMQLFQTKAALISAEAQSNVISKQIAKVDRELERLRGLKSGLDQLRRQVKADEANYLNYLGKVGTVPPQDYQVQVGDQLDIKFFFNPELNESISVRPDGRIALQLIGELSVVGQTVEEIREILIENYAGQIKTPEIAVILRTSHVLAGSMNQQGSNTNAGASSDGN